MMQNLRLVVGVAVLAGLCACQSRRIGPTPAPYPAARPQPLDVALASQARQILADQVHAPSPETRIHALEAISLAGGTGQASEIIRSLSDGEGSVRYAAAMAAGQLRLADAT